MDRLAYNKQKREYYKKHKEYFINKDKRWREKNRGKVLQSVKDYRIRLKVNTLLQYGKLVCIMCGEKDIKLLSLDHVNGDGKEHRKNVRGRGKGLNAFYLFLRRENYPKTPPLQILCRSCNSKKQ